MQAAPAYEREEFCRVAGETLRPGGLELTGRGAILAEFAPGDRLLDLGCGPGATLRYLGGQGCAVCGLDASAELAGRARDKGPVVRGLGQSLPFAGAAFDGVFCECVLSASGDGPGLLDEIARVLRPGGRLVLSDLFLRSGGPTAEGTGCAAGAVSWETLRDRLAAAGLAPHIFEDHTRLLTELACRLTFALGSAKSVVAMLTGRDPACASAAGPRPRFGYCLVIAQKESP